MKFLPLTVTTVVMASPWTQTYTSCHTHTIHPVGSCGLHNISTTLLIKLLVLIGPSFCHNFDILNCQSQLVSNLDPDCELISYLPCNHSHICNVDLNWSSIILLWIFENLFQEDACFSCNIELRIVYVSFFWN